MCNDAIRVAITEKPRNRFELITRSYQKLKEYGLHTHYIQNACEVAFSAFRKRDRKSNPHVKRPFLKLDNQTYKLDYLLLRIPVQPRNFLYITLKGSAYHRSYLADARLKRGSITITTDSTIVTFSKATAVIEPVGQIGIDVNERNITCSNTNGQTQVFDTSNTTEIKERYRAIHAKLAQRTSKDARIRQGLLRKYGRRERNRTEQVIHRVTKQIVQSAKENGFAIVLEKLRNIRKLYTRANDQGKSFRGRMNSWAFREIQRQVEYKASWQGLPVYYVNPRGTSRDCSNCSSHLEELDGRRMLCPQCGQTWDRDVNASKNIMMAAPPVRAARPSMCSHDGECSEDVAHPLSRRMEVNQPLGPAS